MAVTELLEKLYEIDTFAKMRERRAEVLSEPIIFDLDQGLSVLEVGTGKGDIYHSLATKYPNQFFSLDIEDQVVGCNEVYEGNRLLGDGRSLPFYDNAFDIGYACSVLHHIPPKDLIMVMNELFRVAKKVVIIEDSIDKTLFSSNKLQEGLVRGLDRFINIGVPGAYVANQQSFQNWKTLIGSCGAQITDVYKFNHPVLGVIPFSHIVMHANKCVENNDC